MNTEEMILSEVQALRRETSDGFSRTDGRIDELHSRVTEIATDCSARKVTLGDCDSRSKANERSFRKLMMICAGLVGGSHGAVALIKGLLK